MNSARFGRSQFGLLHKGQTLGFSALSRGNHSCPHRHRQPGSITIPISGWAFVARFIAPSLSTNSIYQYSCQLLMVYTTGNQGDRLWA
jgi:hypothetical protein